MADHERLTGAARRAAIKRDGAASKSGIQVVTVPDSLGIGICRECGNGLWPGQKPCDHRSDEWLAAHATREALK